MLRPSLVLLAALLLPGCPKSTPVEPAAPAEAASALPGGFELIETVERGDSDVVIPYKKYQLPNGLTVILHEDNSDPLVHVDVTYHVGSGREEAGRSGFAHFFEHMMFQGSENVADEQHFEMITAAGGTLNGTTNTDRTNYFETVPSNQLEKMLWLEADRMGFLLPAVTQEKFENQRETVKNERGQRVDNRPYGLLGERVGEAMFPEGHPYSWSVIGYLEDLDRADVDDLKRFFLRWYGPNNATLTVGGKIDEAQTLEMIAKYFGSIPRGPEVEPPVPEKVTLDADRYISLEDNVALPLIYMSWPTVYARHPDEAPLDVLMQILGVGKTSLLYKNLQKDGLAVQAAAGHGCRELHCEFTLLALANPAKGKTLAEIETVLRDSLTEFEERGVQDDDLARVKAGIIAGEVFGLESVSGKVSQLAFYETFGGNPNYVQQQIDRYSNVTKEDVVRVYNTYIKDQNAVVMSIVPKGGEVAPAKPDTWERYERTIPEKVAETELAMREPTDTFDRSVQPAAGAENPTVTVPPLWKGTLSGNAVPVLGALNDETPTTAVKFRLAVAQKHEPVGKLGLASMTASMLDEATTKSTNEELSNRVEKLGSRISISSGDNYTEITVQSLTSNLDASLAIVAERLLTPKFDAADFDRLKNQYIQTIESNKKDPATTADNVFKQLLYGKDNAFAYPDLGTLKTVESITLDDVKAFYDTHYSASVASILVVSDLEQPELMEKLEVFGALPTKEVAAPVLKDAPELKGGTLYLVDKPAAAQSEIRIGRRAMPFDATGEYHEANLVNYPVAGAFNSRVNLNLREDKGYTYGARGGFQGDLEGATPAERACALTSPRRRSPSSSTSSRASTTTASLRKSSPSPRAPSGSATPASMRRRARSSTSSPPSRPTACRQTSSTSRPRCWQGSTRPEQTRWPALGSTPPT